MSLTMQNALAVGETREMIEKAELTTLKLRVTSHIAIVYSVTNN